MCSVSCSSGRSVDRVRKCKASPEHLGLATVHHSECFQVFEASYKTMHVSNIVKCPKRVKGGTLIKLIAIFAGRYEYS